MNSAVVGALAASIGVPLIFALFARLFPAAKLDESGPSLDDLRPRYQKWEALFGVSFLILCAPVALGLWTCLRWLSDWHASLLPSAPVALTTMPIYWLIPAMFLSMLCAAAPLTAISKRLLKDRHQEYERYQTLKVGFDQARVSRLLAVGLASLCGLAIFLGLNWYVLITQDEIVINRFFSLTEERYAIASIESIRSAPKLIAPNDYVVSRREFVVTFSQGQQWSTNSLPAELDSEAKQTLMNNLSDKRGIAIEEVDVFQWGDL